jgi:hypothetical protein
VSGGVMWVIYEMGRSEEKREKVDEIRSREGKTHEFVKWGLVLLEGPLGRVLGVGYERGGTDFDKVGNRTPSSRRIGVGNRLLTELPEIVVVIVVGGGDGPFTVLAEIIVVIVVGLGGGRGGPGGG